MVNRSRGPSARGRPTEVEAVLGRIVQVIKEEYHPETIILFGSHAHGTASDESDIDLLIVKRTTKPFHERYAEVGGIIREVRRGWAVSPFVLSPSELRQRLRAGDQFLMDIVERGRVLYGRKGIPSSG